MHRQEQPPSAIRGMVLVVQKAIPKVKHTVLFDFVFACCVGLGYFLHSLRFHGPAYISDEVGYLAKAIIISGNSFETNPGGWHGGYSFLIAPAFAFAGNPQEAWVGVLGVNALMWALSFLLLAKILRTLFPQVGKTKFYLCLAICALYPTWISMSGYSFSTPALALFSIASLAFLIKSDLAANRYLFLFALCVGYMYWIHTIGIAFALVAVMLFAHRMVTTRTFTPYFGLIMVTASMVIGYQKFVQPALNTRLAPPDTDTQGHYAAADLVGSVGSLSGLFEWLVAIAGHLGYVLIASFGIVGYAVWEGLQKLWEQLRSFGIKPDQGHQTSEAKEAALAWTIGTYVLAFLGVIALSSLYLSSEGQATQADHVLYGRHSDSVMLPLLGIGILLPWTFRKTAFLASLVMLTGFGFAVFESRFSDLTSVNMVNVVGLWPRLISPDVHVFNWFALGAAGVAVAALLVKLGKKPALFLLVPVFFLTVQQQTEWHEEILSDYSSESGLQPFVESHHGDGTCVGLEKPADSDFSDNLELRERPRLQSYYMYHYDVKQLTLNEWFETCDGPYITPYKNHELGDDAITYVAQEESSGLFVVVKTDQVDKLEYDFLNDSENLYFPLDDECVSAGCFRADAKQLSNYSNAGILENGRLVSSGNAGELFFGPYTDLSAGSYLLELDMHVQDEGSDVTVSITSNEVDDFQLEEIKPFSKYTFAVPENVSDFEVTVKVGNGSHVVADGYEIFLLDTASKPVK